MSDQRGRGPFLTAMAVLFGVLAFSNATKAWQNLRDPTHLGIVVFGLRFETFTSNLAIGLALRPRDLFLRPLDAEALGAPTLDRVCLLGAGQPGALLVPADEPGYPVRPRYSGLPC